MILEFLKRNAVPAFVAIVFAAPTMWWLMDRQPPYENHVGRIIPDNPKPGDLITVEWKLDIHRVCDGWIQREIVDRHGAIACIYDKQPAIRRDQLYAQQVGSEPDRLSRSFPLCARATPGPAKYRAYTCYQCNPLQRWVWPICLHTPDIEFTIARPENNTVPTVRP